MGVNYRLIDHTADIGIKVWGPTLAGLFVHAAQAMFDIMLEGWTSPSGAVASRVVVEAEDVERLLVKWLQKLLYEFDTNRNIACNIEMADISPTRLDANVAFTPFDPERHTLKTELKAVTYHQLCVKQTAPTRREAQIIFDV